MIDLAVVNRAETFERMAKPLEERGIRCHHVPVDERVIPLGENAPWTSGEFDVGYVYPGRLMEGGVADVLLAVPWLNGRDAVVTSRNKAGVIARLDHEGIPVPETVYISNPVDERALREAFDLLEPPVVIKPNSTTRGVGVAKADDLDSFLGICDYLDLVHDFRATGDKSFLVQEFLPDAVDYRVMVLEGEYVGAVERRLARDALEDEGWKHNVHRGATASAVEPSESTRETAESVAKTLDIPFAGVDILVTEDRAVVSETNARPTIDAAAKYEAGFYDRLSSAIEHRARDESRG